MILGQCFWLEQDDPGKHHATGVAYQEQVPQITFAA